MQGWFSVAMARCSNSSPVTYEGERNYILETKQANRLPVSKFATVALALDYALLSLGNIDSLRGNVPLLQTLMGCVRNFFPGEWLTEQI